MQRTIDSCLKEMKNKQFRLTPQREALLIALVKEKDAHLTPYQLFEKAKHGCPDLGLATVYRTLEIFTKLGLVREIQFKKVVTHYEFIGSNGNTQHYHLVCKKCGRIEKLNGLPSRNFIDVVDQKVGFLITDYSCQFYGICSKCRKNMNNNAENDLADNLKEKLSEGERC